ncbi:MAG: hypothetical protein M1530_01260 [Candidatus Marsarchaeota archaeon]|nr:hypothetical protein [Candidatus Marsarchaeota archaeon]
MRMCMGLIPVKGLVSAELAQNGGIRCSLRNGKRVKTEAGSLPGCAHRGSCLAQFRNAEGRFCTMDHPPYAEAPRK